MVGVMESGSIVKPIVDDYSIDFAGIAQVHLPPRVGRVPCMETVRPVFDAINGSTGILRRRRAGESGLGMSGQYRADQKQRTGVAEPELR